MPSPINPLLPSREGHQRGRSPTVGQPATGQWLDSRRRANGE
ncbi:hypothetical protein LINPERPRIM_LOCUS8879, partial [Linum perenne]